MKFKVQSLKFKVAEGNFKIPDLINVLLENRGIKTKKEIEEFLNPRIEKVTPKNVGINIKQLEKAVKRIKEAIKNKEQIVVFGDYDVDGICGTAILWETLNSIGAKVMPYIPHRIDEGYGLSETGIKNLEFRIKNCKLIITVDNGIVANIAVEFANKNGIDVIITDHHVPSKIKPKASAIVHTTQLCGTGVAYLLAQKLKIKNEKLKIVEEKHLELVALATVADLVPLKGANRTLLTFGLEALRQTKRIGLLELFKEAVLDPKKISVYEIGHMIAPRLNAMGRLEYAMDSLRLLCTNNKKRAEDLAKLLGSTNRERQEITMQTVLHAKEYFKNQKTKNLLFVAHETYEQGVIGLVAGRMVEEYYRPAIVVSLGDKFSKGSARSVRGFNIIEFIRGSSDLLVDAGGHPMAAGFTVETTKLLELQRVLEKKAESMLTKDLLTPNLRIDCQLPLSFISFDAYDALQKLAPFGIGNPEPTFLSKNVIIEDMRLVGKDGKHLKFKIKDQRSNMQMDGIGFGLGEMSAKIRIGDKVDIVYTISQDEWNGNKRLQLKIKNLTSIS